LVPRDKKKRFIIRLRKDRQQRSGELKAPVLELARATALSRWRVEAAIRLIRQAEDLEDIRVRTCERSRNMTALVTAAMYFTAVHLGTRIKLHILASRAIAAAKRFFGVPDFRPYAVADGIRELLQRHPRPGIPPPRAPSLQLSLALL
jgi:hypothetical protein